MVEVPEQSVSEISKDGGEKEAVNPSEIHRQALEWHGEFHKKIEGPDFHNEEHIDAAIESALVTIDAAIEGKDEWFNLQKDLERWNENNPGHEIVDLQEFKVVCEIAFSAHDTGNIMEGVSVDQRGNLVPKYLDKYRAKTDANGNPQEAEDRSIAIMQQMIRNDNSIPLDKKEAYIKLSTLLISNTRFIFGVREYVRDQREPEFFRFVMAMDQIGSSYFRKDDEGSVAGLIREGASEDPDKSTVNPRFFLNFATMRFGQLVDWDPPEKRQEFVRSVWGKEQSPVDEEVVSKGFRSKEFVGWMEEYVTENPNEKSYFNVIKQVAQDHQGSALS